MRARHDNGVGDLSYYRSRGSASWGHGGLCAGGEGRGVEGRGGDMDRWMDVGVFWYGTSVLFLFDSDM